MHAEENEYAAINRRNGAAIDFYRGGFNALENDFHGFFMGNCKYMKNWL
jgi:hypothetical protein